MSETLGPKKTLVVPYDLNAAGGGSCVGAWVLMALRDRYDVSVLTWAPTDVAITNKNFATNLRQDDCRWRAVPPWVRQCLSWAPTHLAQLQNQILLREARRLRRAEQVDLVIGAINEIDIGETAIQYIRFPWSYWPRPASDLRCYHFAPLVRLYRKLTAWVSGYQQESVARNPAFANSDWTGRIYEACYGVRPQTLYPPVPGGFPAVPFEERKPAFVCIGRLAPEKRVDEIIEVVARVRARGHELKLCIVGHRESARYLNKLHALAAPHRDWITFHHDIPRDEMVRLVSECRFGIHGMKDEHFGIAVAELQHAGCITFLRNGGGAPEIVDRDERLVFDSVDDAVEKIDRVLRDGDLQADLRREVELRRGRFTEEHFVRRIREVAASFENATAASR